MIRGSDSGMWISFILMMLKMMMTLRLGMRLRLKMRENEERGWYKGAA